MIDPALLAAFRIDPVLVDRRGALALLLLLGPAVGGHALLQRLPVRDPAAGGRARDFPRHALEGRRLLRREVDRGPRGGVASGRASIAIEASRAAAAASGAANGAGRPRSTPSASRTARARAPARSAPSAPPRPARARRRRRQRRRQGRGRVERGPRCQGVGGGRGRHPRLGRRQPGVRPDRVNVGWRACCA